MPRNPHKRPCRIPGCRAWAKRGNLLCSSHLARAAHAPVASAAPTLWPSSMPELSHQLQVQAGNSQPLPTHLLDALARLHTANERAIVLPHDDATLIEQELHSLLALRSFVLAWIQDPSQPPGSAALSTLIRTWHDSASRIALLLRVRYALVSGRGSEALTLLYSALDELVVDLPDAEREREPPSRGTEDV